MHKTFQNSGKKSYREHTFKNTLHTISQIGGKALLIGRVLPEWQDFQKLV